MSTAFGPSELILVTAEALRRLPPLPPAAPLLVGFGGGPDALALAWVLGRLGHPLRLAFVDHGPPLDGPWSWAAAQAGAAWLGLPVERLAPSGPLASEGAAREARHEALQAKAKALGLAALALGHHQDDQAETLLFRLSRGAGLAGAAGMAPWRAGLAVPVLRPLLGLRRRELRAALTALGAPVHEDPANADLGRSRNRLRHRVLPELEAIAPGAGARLAQAAERFGQAEAWLVAEAEAWHPALNPGGQAWDQASWLALPLPLQAATWALALRRWGAPASLGEAKSLEALRLAMHQCRALALSGGWRWLPDAWPWGRLLPPHLDEGWPLGGPGGAWVGAGGLLRWRALGKAGAWPEGGAGGLVGHGPAWALEVPLVGPAGPWRWRPLRPQGDRLWGPGQRPQPLARLLHRLGWPEARAAEAWGLASGPELAWWPGAWGLDPGPVEGAGPGWRLRWEALLPGPAGAVSGDTAAR